MYAVTLWGFPLSGWFLGNLGRLRRSAPEPCAAFSQRRPSEGSYLDKRDYERIFQLDLDQDRCRVLKNDTETGQPSETSFTAWREELLRGGRVYPEDARKLMDFLTPERLRACAQAEARERRFLYRCRTDQGDYRWNQLELLWGQEEGYLLCARDIHEVIRESLVREGLDERALERIQQDIQMADILKSRFKMMNTVDLETGQCRRVDLSDPNGTERALVGDYSVFIQRALQHFVHPDDTEIYRSTLSLEHLRERAERTEDYAEEICVYRQRGEELRWIELRVIYARKDGHISVNILGQDVTREKRAEEVRRQLLEERDSMISSISSLFFSTYYIDLEHNTFRAVTQLRRVGDLLGEEVDCNAGFRIYANHFIHPDDREEYLRTMDCQNLRQALRWWHPCVAVEYRKLPDLPGDDTYEWVRATAVLARSGSDDLPKNAVYVAQSITENRRQIS